MSQYKYAEIGDTVYFWFAANTTLGSAGDGATPLYDVRLAGAASGAAPAASGTPTLLTHGDYTDGLHEIAIATGALAAGEYAVFCTLTISSVNPAGFCGSFKLRTAGTSALATNVVGSLPNDLITAASINTGALTADAFAADAIVAATLATGVLTADAFAADAIAAAAVKADAVTKIQTGLATPTNITAASGVTLAATTGLGNQTANITGNLSGSVGSVTTVSDKTGYALSSAGVTAIWAEVMEGTITAVQAMRGLIATAFGELSGAATTTITIRDASDTKTRVTATVDADGNRSAVTTDLT